MHICFAAIDYHTSQSGGGIASYVNTLGGELVRRGHQVTVVSLGVNEKETLVDGIRVIFTKLGNVHWYLHKIRFTSFAVMPIRELEWSWSLKQVVDKIDTTNPIDIVEGTENGCLLGAFFWKKFPLVIRLHGDQFTFTKHSQSYISIGMRINRAMTLIALRKAHSITAPSRFAVQEAVNQLGWSTKRVQIIANPINPMFLEQTTSHVPLSLISADQVKIIYTGRIERCKGTLILFRSIPIVVRKLPHARFVVVGGQHVSISDALLQRELDRDNVRAYCDLLGHIPWHNLIALYRKATIFVMPSLYESFGISIIEAMACGLPVVATTAGAIPEVVEHGVTGLLVPPGDSIALAEAIIQLARDPELRSRLGKAGRERVQSMFTVGHVADQTLSVYEACKR
ncbi:MAG: glycosyltransferase family 4 protein [Oscillochloridaceae bacterium umkhey_bin13]